MSIENYSKELRNYISTKTKFINDESFQTKEELINNPKLIYDFIEREFSEEETSCLFFYLSYLIQDQKYLNEIIEKINQKFLEQKIKAREMPDIHYLIVYKMPEEKFLEENIHKIKNYFEDYLKEVKEAEEQVKKQKKMEEELRLKEQKEKEKRERVILPKINNFELVEIKENTIVILVPLFDEKEIINKNKNNITNCEEKLGKEKIAYVVYLYNIETNTYDERIIEKKEKNILKGNKYKLELTGIKSSCLYLFLLGIKFGNNYSSCTSNKFYFMSYPEAKSGKIIIFGDSQYKNNFVDIEDQKDKIILPKGKSYSNCISPIKDDPTNFKTLQPLLYPDVIQDISISETRSIFLNSSDLVIQAGQVLYVTSAIEEGKDSDDNIKDFFEGSFPKDKIIKTDDDKLYKIDYEYVNPYIIEFPYPKIKIKKVRAGLKHCLALDSNGEVYSWGENDFGQLGLGKDKNEIVGNPQRIKFDIFDLDGHKYLTDQRPIFYDITASSFSSLALSIFNNRQILYYWGKGAGVLNNNVPNEIVLSTYPLPISGVENIKKIYARYNSIGIFCWDNEKKLNVLYIHGTQKFGIDAGLGIYEKPKPVIVNFFRDEGINVLNVNFSRNSIGVLGQNKQGEIEVYLRGELSKKLFDFKEFKRKFMKLEKEWAKDVVALSPQENAIFFLLKNGKVKKLWKNKDILEEKEIIIEGYDEILKNLNTNDINKIEFQSFSDDNIVIFYPFK